MFALFVSALLIALAVAAMAGSNPYVFVVALVASIGALWYIGEGRGWWA